MMFYDKFNYIHDLVWCLDSTLHTHLTVRAFSSGIAMTIDVILSVSAFSLVDINLFE